MPTFVGNGTDQRNVSIFVFFPWLFLVVFGNKQKYQMFTWQRGDANVRNENYLREYSFSTAPVHLTQFFDFSVKRH